MIVAAVSLSACDESLSSIAGPDTPNLEPTFTAVQRDILLFAETSGRRNCTFCHNANGRVPPLQLNFDAPDVYTRLVNIPSRVRTGELLVVPGDPENSYLIKKLEGRDIAGGRMPLNGPYLTPGQISIIRRWIELGADNN